MDATPRKYALGPTHHAPPKSAPAISAIIGSFAPQGMKVVVIIVIFLSLSLSIVREAIIPGTPQPVPTSIGINDLPESPNLRKILSIMNATRAIYPQPSSIARNIKRSRICGTNPSTAPTPPTIPSSTRLLSQSAHPIAFSAFSKNTGIPGITILSIPKRCHSSPNSPSFAQSVSTPPSVVTDT